MLIQFGTRNGINYSFGLREIAGGHGVTYINHHEACIAWAITIIISIILVVIDIIITKMLKNKISKILLNVIIIGAIVLFITNRIFSIVYIKNIIYEEDKRNQELINEYGSANMRIKVYNSQFIDYKGKNKTANEVKYFFKMVGEHNKAVKEDVYYSLYPMFQINGVVEDSIKDRKNYTIDDFKFDSKGYAVECTITENE